MTRWYDCPVCIGYCEEYIRPEDGLNVCEACGTMVWFEPAPKEMKDQLYKVGIWVEYIVCLDDDGMVLINPAFATEAEYQKWIELNAIRMRAECDQLTSLLTEQHDVEG